MRGKYSPILAFLALLLLCSSLLAMSETEYNRKAVRFHVINVLTFNDLQKARTNTPSAAVEIRGQVSGILTAPDKKLLMIKLPDGQCMEVTTTSLPCDIQTGVRVRCLASNPKDKTIGPLNLEAIIIDVGKPPVVKKQPSAKAAAAKSDSLSSRGENDILLRCKRAIIHFNPKLSSQDVEVIASSIVHYSNYLGVDPFFVVAVVAAESRFNPKARSYKGAMGLGQLMPSTAKGMGVKDPYDPVENLLAAVRILRGNLEKYKGQTNQEALALAAYNAGSGAVAKYGGVPPYRETRDYIWKVHEYYCLLHGIPPEPRPKK